MPEVRVVITDRCILPSEEESLPPYQFHVPVHFLVQYGLRCADGPDSLEEPVFPCKAEFGQFPVIGLGQEEGVLPLPYRIGGSTFSRSRYSFFVISSKGAHSACR